MNWKSIFKRYEYNIKVYAVIYVISFFAVLYVLFSLTSLLHTEVWVKGMVKSGINYDAFRDLKITEDVLQTAEDRVTHFIKKHPSLKDYSYINTIGYLTFSMLAKNYDPMGNDLADEETFFRGIGKLAGTKSFQELYSCYREILSDIKYFPIPEMKTQEAYVTFDNTWYELRRYGGNRRHEGTDLMASNNLRGYFPVVSVTDGVIENMGWLEQGGYRIGIRSDTGGYFYYAHLYSYAPELKQGDKVIAGQLLGFMGDSGYGTEGTIGKFDVHLHLGIYVKTTIGEISVNPYWILKMLENHKTCYNLIN